METGIDKLALVQANQRISQHLNISIELKNQSRARKQHRR